MLFDIRVRETSNPSFWPWGLNCQMDRHYFLTNAFIEGDIFPVGTCKLDADEVGLPHFSPPGRA
jgi:hypothetical protein